MALTFSLLKMIFLAATSLTTVGVGLLYTYQRSLIYPAAMNNARGFTEKPSKYNLPFEEAFLETRDGERLHSFLLLHDETSPNYKSKTVLILCPNAGNIGHSLPIVELFYKNFGYNVFIYSYRGYGSSTGEATERGLKVDADTVMAFLSKHEQISKTSIVLYGRSLGGAVGIYIASKNYSLIKGVILENTFLNLRKCIPHIFPLLANFTSLCSDLWDSENDILKTSRDVKFLFLSATDDEIVPPNHMIELYRLCQSHQKKIFKFNGSKHNDTVTFPGYWDLISDFIKAIEPVEK
ncbi:hypothetical protein WICPIJ_007864 [Wickerhamomyces pijperi]|uniref:AB hydrolase-1 domain-containing protein n=1 Tax=Wickerhamomyces pijperi TaxID=599730 RepID=A0A9P8TJJ5_WICPI|nr:hypothetical protein WICPIJ_007864 [Wickerhamomyces pijperi]